MSNDREYDLLEASVLKNSQPRDRLDKTWAEDDWQEVIKRELRLVYRAGARANADYQYHKQLDPVDRIRWLSEQGFLGDDLKMLLAEVEEAREQRNSLHGTYGVTDSTIESMLAEGFHTAFRKATDHPYAITIRKLIRELPGDEWESVIKFVAEPLIAMLHQAEKGAETSEA